MLKKIIAGINFMTIEIILKTICLLSTIIFLKLVTLSPKIVMQTPVNNAKTTICRIFPFENGSIMFCGTIDSSKSKIFAVSAESADKICPSKLKFTTGKNISLTKIVTTIINSKIFANLIKTIVPIVFSVTIFSIAQILATIEIKTNGIFTAIIAQKSVFNTGVITFTIIFCVSGEKFSAIIAKIIARSIAIVLEPPGIFKCLISSGKKARISLKPPS